jgi:hypothetical protein
MLGEQPMMSNASGTLYELFGVTPKCSDGELREAFRALLLRYHPDQNPRSVEAATEKTREILAAYEQLRTWRTGDRPRASTTLSHGQTERVRVKIRVEFSSGVSLDRIAELKQELRNAWNELAGHPHDIKAALRFVRAAFQGGRPETAEDLLRNPTLVFCGADSGPDVLSQ